ncbi:S phase cyclin A-associated protein in the endoplasmic reticulum [Senna tora]|uniref:S phase cyclin A-associated protein in the endoplasmic reticulum n=1 Tax=Senna tora TaxID=362788 RepID=A0A834TFF8_9FABA|nr:S phase cyclin A-associated protein in the endoplasmic reticulum [Senna tora]
MKKISISDQAVVFLLSAVSETGLVSLPSLLTAVLLQANNRSSSEQASFILPSNFEEVAAGVLKVRCSARSENGNFPSDELPSFSLHQYHFIFYYMYPN